MGDPGALRRPTIRDVAARADVSKSLVGLVYANPARVSSERRRRVLDAAAELGFQPNFVARSLAGTVHFVTLLVADLHNPLFADIVTAARDALADEGVPSLISAVEGGGAQGPDALTLTLIRDLRPSGVLVVGTIPDLEPVLAVARGRSRVVLASAIAPGDAVPTVRGDDEAGIGLAVDHLIERGHRRIAFVGGRGGPVAAARERAYRAAMTAHGLASQVRVAPSGFAEREGRDAGASLLETLPDSRPTAVVTANDQAAVGVLAAGADFGVRLAVTGYDNSSLAAVPQVSLTSVEPGNTEIGRRAAALVCDADDAGSVLVAPRLVVRSSTPELDRT